MGRSWLLSCWIAAAFVAAAPALAPAAGEEPGVKEQPGPSLEYRPPRETLPEPKAPTPLPPVVLFREIVGGFGIGNGFFDRPSDAAIDKDSNLYVLDVGNSRIQKFDRFGHFVFAWGGYGSRQGEFKNPGAMVLDSDGNLFVVDTGNDRIQKFLLLHRGSGDCPGSGKPLAQSADDKVCFAATWGSRGTRSGDFKNPGDLTFDGAGNVFVVDVGNDRVQKFNAGGGFILEFGRVFGSRGGTFVDLASIAWSDDRMGYLYLLSESCLVQQFEMDGTFLASWPATAPESGLCVPARIRSNNLTGDRYLYILDSGNGLVARFTPDGHFVTALREAQRPFAKPRGLALNPGAGEFAVADTGNNIVQKFTLR